MALADVGTKVVFTLPDQNGKEVKIPNGKWTVLYFYPRDHTPGCTTEACTFRDNHDEFKRLGVQVFGVSTDGVKAHASFAAKHDLPFTLVSDKEKTLTNQLGAVGPFGTARRVTFILDPKGTVRHVYPKVKPADHPAEVLERVKELMEKRA